MGSTYETDGMELKDKLALTIQAAVVMMSLSNMVSCSSWLVARLALREFAENANRLNAIIKEGSK